MKFITKHARAGVLALAPALLNNALAAAGPQSAPSDGCLGETIRVSIEKHVHAKTNLSPAGGYQKGNFAQNTDLDISVHGVYVHQLRDGKLRWVKRSISWGGQYQQNMPACNEFIADAGGHVELGPTDEKPDAAKDQKTIVLSDELKWLHQEQKTFGNCFRVMAGPPGSLPFPDIRKQRKDLRGGCCYSKVETDGTHYAETVEQSGNESVAIRADSTEIVPNATCMDKTDKKCAATDPTEATSQLTVRATCNGLPLSERKIGLRIDVDARSGYHNHVGSAAHPRPYGHLVNVDVNGNKNDQDCGGDKGTPVDNSPCIIVKTDANGVAKVTFRSPLTGVVDFASYGNYNSGIAGSYVITAGETRSAQVKNATGILQSVNSITEVRARATVLAKVKGLEAAKFVGRLQQGRTLPDSDHPEGSYGSHKTLQAFTDLANAFVEAQRDHFTAKCPGGKEIGWPPIVPLQANDIALPDGGVFDWNVTGSPKLPATPWRPSHQTHNKGEGGDFNRFGANSGDSGLNLSDVGTVDCNGHVAIKQFWYAHLLLDLGTKYGHWDCADLQGASIPGGNNLQQVMWNPYLLKGKVNERLSNPSKSSYCKQVGEFSDPLYFPHRLHLHVED
jgi:hypothetical protein